MSPINIDIHNHGVDVGDNGDDGVDEDDLDEDHGSSTMMWMRMMTMVTVVPCFPGAQDFLPDFERTSRWYNVYRIYPKYGPLVSAMRKVKEWMHNARVSIFECCTFCSTLPL